MYRIKKFIEVFNDLSAGNRAIDEELKYRWICIAIAMVHLIYLLVFLFSGRLILALFNVFSVALYSEFIFRLLKTRRYDLLYVAAYAEIMVYSSLCSLMLGWNWGFMLYTIALVPTSFYLTFTMTRQSKHLKSPLGVSFLTIVVFTVVYFLCGSVGPYYTDETGAHRIAYAVNAFVAFAMILLFCFLFVCDIRLTQTAMERKNSILENVSSHDPLTKLINRRSMDLELETAMIDVKVTGRLFSVIMCDIDDFKKVNDTYGHNVGDKVLVAVADVFRNNAPSGAKVCRWGGEEILIWYKAPAKEAISLAEILRQEISKIQITADDGTIVSVTMTFGVAEYIPGYNMTKIISIADDHLYRGKKSGKNCVIGPES